MADAPAVLERIVAGIDAEHLGAHLCSSARSCATAAGGARRSS
ncbi:hypothetical protein FHW23_002085 [Curtobacterium pusillum]|uniref:Uncharacterized protein n=1 Tax=Curtobacterium pusillum TaxID=69373 RepID=A0AAW3T7X9_9MICO|nr:hypothetical protein [Curtobacterium pusillum]MBA8990820.1 hypothetical protein [Curtobacterium pusillum]